MSVSTSTLPMPTALPTSNDRFLLDRQREDRSRREPSREDAAVDLLVRLGQRFDVPVLLNAACEVNRDEAYRRRQVVPLAHLLAFIALHNAGGEVVHWLAGQPWANSLNGRTLVNLEAALDDGIVPTRMASLRCLDELRSGWDWKEVAVWLVGRLGKVPESELATSQPGERLNPRSERYLTYNVWGLPHAFGFGAEAQWRFHRIAEALPALDCDVIALQEMWHPRTECILRKFADRSVARARLIHGLPLCHGLIRSTGLASVVRGKVLEAETLHFSNKSGIEAMVLKSAFWTRVQLAGGQVRDVVNVHAASPPESINRALTTTVAAEDVRLRQFDELQRWIEQRGSPHIPRILMGDMNSDFGSRAYQHLSGFAGVDIHHSRYPCSPNPIEPEIGRSRRGMSMDPEENPWAIGKIPGPQRIDHCWLHGVEPHQVAVRSWREFATPGLILSDHYAPAFEVLTW